MPIYSKLHVDSRQTNVRIYALILLKCFEIRSNTLFVVLYFTLNEFHQVSLSCSYLPAHHDKTMEWSVTKAVKGSIFLQIFSLKYSLNRMLPTHTAKELFMEMQLLFEKKWLLLIGHECGRRALTVSALNFVSRGPGSRLWSVKVL